MVVAPWSAKNILFAWLLLAASYVGNLGTHWVSRQPPTDCLHRDRDVGAEFRGARGACCRWRNDILRIVVSAMIEWPSSSGGGKRYRRRVDGEATCMQKETDKETIGSASSLKHRSARRYLKWGFANNEGRGMIARESCACVSMVGWFKKSPSYVILRAGLDSNIC